MLAKLFNLEDGQKILDMDILLRGSHTLLVLFIIGSIIYTIFHYRSVRAIPSQGRKLTGLCHLLALMIMVIIVAMPVAKIRYSKTYRPIMLMLVDTSRSMDVKDKRVTVEALNEAAQILNGLPLNKKVADDVIQKLLKNKKQSSRLDLVKALLKHPDIDLLRRASERFDVRFFSFDQNLAPEGGAKNAPKWLADREATGEASRIGSAIDEAVSRYTGLPVAGVMVFSDFGWVNGEDPARVSSQLKRKGIPVYPIIFGLPAPPDAMINEIIAPDAVFHGDPVTFRIRLSSRGLDGRNSSLKMKIDGIETATEALSFEEGMQFVEFRIQPKQKTGTLILDFELDGTSLDSNLKNNSRQHRLRIIEEKIKVLYIESMPRWEFRYLRWILLRNPHLKTRFLMTQGDPELAKLSPNFMAQFPKDIRNIFEYDLIIIGDVSSKYFKPEQLKLLEEQIRVHGGSLIMLAGAGAAPSSYKNTPIENILPVRIGSGKAKAARNNEFPRLPEDAAHSPIVILNDSPDINQAIWSKVKPLGRLPALDGAKPLANILLELPGNGGSAYPIVSWHNYGKGKCMFVATDRFWKLRREVGDAQHGKFWGQSIQFLAMSRLLGQNKRISLQTERSRYNPGEAVRVYANVLSETYQPMIKESHTIIVEKKGISDSAQDLMLIPDPSTPGIYFGSLPAGTQGSYVLRAQDKDREISATVEYTVAMDPLEDRDTAAKPEIATAIAKASGTVVVATSELADLVDNLSAPDVSRIISREMELWDSPILYILLLLFVGLEWTLRRRENLL
jgi:uncharacterized membrane protein